MWREAFPKYPSYAVFRNKDNKKWFGVLMTVPGIRLGMESEKEFEVIDLKFDKGQALDFIESCGDEEVRPAYHMNKQNWLTIVFDENKLTDEQLFNLIDKSYELSLASKN